ncbi:hypothetical protein V6N12_040547 [Hibiscus sabdariffa]|uniref:Uncharacterized protein n=1 Tax=Hibiscus sabdariffa TaxID=183260 RepID=A0ABR2E410_9ROSI
MEHVLKGADVMQLRDELVLGRNSLMNGVGFPLRLGFRNLACKLRVVVSFAETCFGMLQHYWSGDLQWACRKLKSKSLLTSILKIAASAFLHGIWQERNGRLFKKLRRSELKILMQIKETASIRLSGKFVNRLL